MLSNRRTFSNVRIFYMNTVQYGSYKSYMIIKQVKLQLTRLAGTINFVKLTISCTFIMHSVYFHYFLSLPLPISPCTALTLFQIPDFILFCGPFTLNRVIYPLGLFTGVQWEAVQLTLTVLDFNLLKINDYYIANTMLEFSVKYQGYILSKPS